MSEGNFEVMPIGTLTELTTLRNFVKMLGRAQDFQEVQELHEELLTWYEAHVQEHMV